MSGTPTVSSTETTGPGDAATVAGIHAAFGRGDIPAILAALPALADDVRWEEWADNTAQRAGVAHLTPRRGRAAGARRGPVPSLRRVGGTGSFYGGGRGSSFSGGWPSG